MQKLPPNEAQAESERKKTFALMGLGMELMASVLVFAGAGWLVGWGFGWNPWGLLVGLVLGVVYGFINLIRTAFRLTAPNKKSRLGSKNGSAS